MKEYLVFPTRDSQRNYRFRSWTFFRNKISDTVEDDSIFVLRYGEIKLKKTMKLNTLKNKTKELFVVGHVKHKRIKHLNKNEKYTLNTIHYTVRILN